MVYRNWTMQYIAIKQGIRCDAVELTPRGCLEYKGSDAETGATVLPLVFFFQIVGKRIRIPVATAAAVQRNQCL